ncbi:precorrin-3B synthase [Microvirga lotononidis]|uniref:Precorrin-3B synthase n=1 Tax=Microvirga lotononidis TaxID=864069 RepID=I4YWT9_9HYPH|nr:precorrin-3B synthase [Microvirga lotononidis]EIM28431.1 precorrin-3B synthase [Microvirga lotononidis]WQO27489.1 precorrin-3B synthase [Microvirga lotononidis]
MNAQPISERRRGWCPGVRRPMATGDGLLVRLHPLSARISAGQARVIAEVARQHGNGHLDITARGNLQIRGVSEETYPALLEILEREGLAEPEGDGPNRLTAVSPLAGLDPLDHGDALALTWAIEDQAAHLDGLPAKFFIAVDGGGSMPLDAIGADLHLVATGAAVAFGRSTPDGLDWIGTAGLTGAPEAARSILAGFAEMRRSGRTDARRLRDLEPGLADELAASATLTRAAPPRKRPAAPHAGLFQTGRGAAVLLALPFGRCNAAQLVQAAAWSERFGGGEIRLSFTRGLLLPGVADEHVAPLLAEAARAGFITTADDPRLSLTACPGRPACASGLTPAPSDALRIAETSGDLLARGASIHVSGCPKGCAYPGKADLTLVGRVDGRYDVVPQGSTRDIPSLTLSLDDIMKNLLPTKPADLRRTALERSR